MKDEKERDPWLRDVEVERLTGISRYTLRNWRHQGRGPKFDKISHRLVRYRLSEIERFMREGK